MDPNSNYSQNMPSNTEPATPQTPSPWGPPMQPNQPQTPEQPLNAQPTMPISQSQPQPAMSAQDLPSWMPQPESARATPKVTQPVQTTEEPWNEAQETAQPQSIPQPQPWATQTPPEQQPVTMQQESESTNPEANTFQVPTQPIQTSQQIVTPEPIQPNNNSVPPVNPPAPLEEDEPHGFPLILKLAIGAIILFIVALIAFFILHSHKSQTSSTNVTLTYWGLWEDKSTMDSIFAGFTREHPNITVNYIKEDPKQYSERLLTRINNGSGPDVFRYHSSWVPELLPVLSPLSQDVITPKDIANNYYPTVKNDLVVNGAIYGLPFEIDTLSLFVNDDILQKSGVTAPTTWNDFVKAAKTLTVTDTNGKIKTAGAGLGTYDNVTHAPDIMSMLFAQSNVDPNNLTKNVNGAADALTFYTSFAQGASAVWDGSLDPTWIAFAKGNLAMYFGYSWDIFQIRTLNPNLRFSVHPVPHLPNHPQTTASYWVEGISNKSKHQTEAQLLLAYLAQKDTMQQLYTEESKTRQFGEPYARTDLADSVKSDPFVGPFLTSAKDAVSSYFVGETNDTGINGPLNGYLATAISSVLGNTSPQSAITTLTQGVSQILSKYGITSK